MSPDQRCGPFELLHRIDAGGMGEIYLARPAGAPDYSGLVALKRVLPKLATDHTFIGMFQDEGRLAVRLDHPHICRVLESSEADGNYFMVMEWIHGVTVRAIIDRLGPRTEIPASIAARIAADTASALAYAHVLRDEEGKDLHIIHRDVSPGNIMVKFDGTVKLLDFGLAKARSQVHKTLPGVVKGKFRYLAPEQTKTDPIDHRVDIFSLGLCLHELLTGRALFDQPGDLDTVLALRAHKSPPSVRTVRTELPEAVDAILGKALAAEPENRYTTAAAFHADLERLAKDVTPAHLRAFLVEHFDPNAPQVEVPASPLAHALVKVSDPPPRSVPPPPAPGTPPKARAAPPVPPTRAAPKTAALGAVPKGAARPSPETAPRSGRRRVAWIAAALVLLGAITAATLLLGT